MHPGFIKLQLGEILYIYLGFIRLQSYYRIGAVYSNSQQLIFSSVLEMQSSDQFHTNRLFFWSADIYFSLDWRIFPISCISQRNQKGWLYWSWWSLRNIKNTSWYFHISKAYCNVDNCTILALECITGKPWRFVNCKSCIKW